MILLAVLIGLTAALYPLSHLGFRDGLQALLQQLRHRPRAVPAGGRDALVRPGTDRDRQPHAGTVHCRCPVVGTWKNGFIVLHQDQARGGRPERGAAQPVSGRRPG